MNRLTGGRAGGATRSTHTHTRPQHTGATVPHTNHHTNHHTTTARPVKRSRFGGGRTRRAPVGTAAPRRRTSIGDKLSGAMLKLRGSLTGKPGVKAAGTRRMHGTDGRGARRVY